MTFDVEKTIISQYAHQRTGATLQRNVALYLDPLDNFDDFYSFVWDVATAQGFGLDIWGRIVNVARVINVPASTPNPGGFPFTAGAYTMDDTQYRNVILFKALANITACDSGSFNNLLSQLFASRGRCYVLDPGGMRMQYTFEFWLEPYEYVIITGGIAPHPAGVLVLVYQVDVSTTFGFDEAVSLQPFDQGTFLG